MSLLAGSSNALELFEKPTSAVLGDLCMCAMLDQWINEAFYICMTQVQVSMITMLMLVGLEAYAVVCEKKHY